MKNREVDMSPEGVARRLDELSQLYEMWCSLRHARVLGPLEQQPPQPLPHEEQLESKG